jgi:O-acetyl-ADP-ribose deacetylase (regulator of RNase III)
MKISYLNGDFLAGPETYVLHGCNALGKMESGAAKSLRAKYPKAYDDYLTHRHDRGLRLGEVIVSEQNGVVIFNCITQQDYGRDESIQYVNYFALRNCIKTVDIYMGAVGIFCSGVPVAMPKIGCGLGNGDWGIVGKIIEEESNHFLPFVYIQ